MRVLDYERFGADGPPRGHSRLLLIDDHAIMRDGLRVLLDAELDMRIVAEAGSVAEGIALCRTLQPDLVIIDHSFPLGSGIEAIASLRRDCESVKIIVLTVHNTRECLQAALNAGANGFVAKDAAYDVLLKAIRWAISHNEQTPRSLSSARVQGRLTVRRHPAPTLTPREHQVLLGVAQGYSSKQIAANLHRSVKTIVKHRSNMMRKLSLHDASAVTRFAISNGLLPL